MSRMKRVTEYYHDKIKDHLLTVADNLRDELGISYPESAAIVAELLETHAEEINTVLEECHE